MAAQIHQELSEMTVSQKKHMALEDEAAVQVQRAES